MKRDDGCTLGWWLRPALWVPNAEDGPAPSQVVTRVLHGVLAHGLDLTEHCLLSFQAPCASLVEGGGNYANKTLEASEVAAVTENLVVSMPCPALAFPRENPQVLFHNSLVGRENDSRILFSGLPHLFQQCSTLQLDSAAASV